MEKMKFSKNSDLFHLFSIERSIGDPNKKIKGKVLLCWRKFYSGIKVLLSRIPRELGTIQ